MAHPNGSPCASSQRMQGGRPEVVVLHERIADQRARDSHEHGWNGCLDGLSSWLLPSAT